MTVDNVRGVVASAVIHNSACVGVAVNWLTQVLYITSFYENVTRFL